MTTSTTDTGLIDQVTYYQLPDGEVGFFRQVVTPDGRVSLEDGNEPPSGAVLITAEAYEEALTLHADQFLAFMDAQRAAYEAEQAQAVAEAASVLYGLGMTQAQAAAVLRVDAESLPAPAGEQPAHDHNQGGGNGGEDGAPPTKAPAKKAAAKKGASGG